MMKLKINYPSEEEELEILRKISVVNENTDLSPVINTKEIRDTVGK